MTTKRKEKPTCRHPQSMNYRNKNADWELYPLANGNFSLDAVKCALLMDIRDELRSLNELLGCDNFRAVPKRLSRIEANTRRPKRERKPAKRRR